MFVLKLLKLSTVWFAKVCTTVIDKLSCAIWWGKKSHMIYKKQKSYRYNIRQKGCGANRCNGKQRIYKLLRIYMYILSSQTVSFFSWISLMPDFETDYQPSSQNELKCYWILHTITSYSSHINWLPDYFILYTSCTSYITWMPDSSKITPGKKYSI